MAKASKNDQAVLKNLLKAGMVKPSLPKAIDPKASMQAAINARKAELHHHAV